ncbi:sulfurtransferase complex subunit TusC [Phytohalomonas tamaricis]|uniref:sulfurtransferase complex subunit TusC n=1 Tax=Phytohalomonas tamaricis TaxID=2081032 RepID=UPI000D0BA0BF|nr:sulfurtransferase complex subunit TusC [Phytohalomonas tamaricis]
MTSKRILIVLRHAPHGSSWSREGLEAALVGAALGQEVSLLFMGDGVFTLCSEQQVGALGQKGTAPMIDVLPMYDIERLCVDEQALIARGLETKDLMVAIEYVDPAELIAEHDIVLTF